MTPAAQQPSREELLAIGKRKLLQFQQSKGKAHATADTATTQPAAPSTSYSASVAPTSFTSRLPSVTTNGTSDAASQYNQLASFPSSLSQPASASTSLPTVSLQPAASSLPPALAPTPTPRRDLFPFLDAAGTSEPSTPPSSDFHAPHSSFLQPDQTNDRLPPSSSSSSSVTPAITPATHSVTPSFSQSFVPPLSSASSADGDVGSAVESSYSAYDAAADYNPYAEPPPAVLGRSGAATPQPADSQPLPPSSSATTVHPVPPTQSDAASAVVDEDSASSSFSSYFPSSLPSSVSSTSIRDHTVPASSTAFSSAVDSSHPALSSSSADTAPVPSTASSAPSSASTAFSTEAEQPYDAAAATASVQYYQDDAGNIFYYAADGQPVYYNQATGEYSTTPPSTSTTAASLSSTSSSHTTGTAASAEDVVTLQQKVAEYERYIVTLQSSLVSSAASPLPALSSLSSELDVSRTENERLQGQLRQLQSRLDSQGKSMRELIDDNATLVHEYEEVCEQLNSAEEERRQGWMRQRDANTELAAREDGLRVAGRELCEHGDVLQQLSDDSARMQRELVEGMQLTTTIRSQWQHILQLIQRAHDHSIAHSTHLTSDSSNSPTAMVRVNGIDGSKADWLSVLEQAEALSSFLSQKDDHDHQLSMYLANIRQLLDPVSLVLSPPHSNTSTTTLPLLMPTYSSSPSSSVSSSSTAIVPSASTTSAAFDSFSSSSSSSTASTAVLSSLQAEKSMLQEQLAAQQERAAALIKDKVMLAKRIEAAFEEKAVLTESLREALDQLGREKEAYKQAVQEAHEAAIRTANTTAYSSSPASIASQQYPYDRYADDSTSIHAAYQRLHRPMRQGPNDTLSRSAASTHRALASRRKEHDDTKSGLFDSLWSMVFGSNIAAVVADDEDEDEEAVDDRDLEADRVIVV